MNLNFNTPPADRTLPASFEGKEPIHVVQAVIADEATEPAYKALCKDGSYVVIPLSKFGKKEGA